MKFRHAAAIGSLLLSLFAPALRADTATEIEFFEKKIRPVLVEHCYQCHSALSKELKGGLRVDHRDGLRKGGDTGPAVVPQKAGESLLLDALRHDGLEMPPDEKLPAHVIADFQKWIESGAIDPREVPADNESGVKLATAERFAQLRTWWSLQPVQKPAVPETKTQGWSASEIDRFILARLEQEGLAPAASADRKTLLRRLSFTLLGLPPSTEDANAFANDSSEAAWENVVDRMMGSPHFGEHFARHWMDVVRYSDTYGYEWDIPAKGAWRYRDYLTRAFNADVPVDQLFREQIAGDLLPSPRRNEIDQINESKIGPFFFQMGEKRHGDSSEFDGIHQEMLDNKIDAFSKTFLAITVSCARCHDHKIDPILQKEYYAIGGMFMSSRWVTNTVDLPERQADAKRELASIKDKLRGELAKRWQSDLQALSNDVLEAKLKDVDRMKLAMENWLYPWNKLQEASASEEAFAKAWSTLSAEYSAQQQTRQQKNAAEFTLVADFRRDVPAGWSIDGVGLQSPSPRGDFIVSLAGDRAIDGIIPGGLATNAISPRFNGALRTPYLNTMPGGSLTFEMYGGEFAAQRGVIDNAFLTEKQQYLNAPRAGWMRLDTFGGMRQRNVYLEFATKTSNPNFPPRVGLGGACSEEQVADPRSWFGISRVYSHQGAGAPADELVRFGELFAGEAPKSLAQVLERYQRWLIAAVDRWAKGSSTEEDVPLLNTLLDQSLLTNRGDAALIDSYRRVERSLAEPWTVNGMADIDPGLNLRLHIRGEYDQLADLVPRGSIGLITASPDVQTPRSGRLELAEQIVSPTNPLTARVFVNRVWQWLFGTGIVPTSNDFGHLGAKPSHPELLDYLAARFVEEGWSLKRLVREIVVSSSWQQASDASPAAEQNDPGNRWLSHFPRRRLPAESIRDAMLVASGRFDAKLDGPPINPPRTSEDAQKRLFSGPLDGLGRRSIYIKATIMEPPRFLAIFNQPPPKISTGFRDLTSTPAQSLTLLNDPFVHEQAQHWATQLVARSESLDARIDHLFTTALGRSASSTELLRWQTFVRELAEESQVEPVAMMSSPAVWKEAAHTIFNTKEFLYIK